LSDSWPERNPRGILCAGLISSAPFSHAEFPPQTRHNILLQKNFTNLHWLARVRNHCA
jgi:hypothetical protein